ncbi:MAG: hypothetical protein WBV82_18740 [Myxococcaceae bacterium]
MVKLIAGVLAAAGLVLAGCETKREEAVEEQQGVGGAGIYEEPGEESVFEIEPPAGQQQEKQQQERQQQEGMEQPGTQQNQ